MRGKHIFKILNPFQELIETRKELKKLTEESDRLDHELKEIREKKKKAIYTKH